MKKLFTISLILLCGLLGSAFLIANLQKQDTDTSVQNPHIIPIATGATDEAPVETKPAIKPKSKIEELKKRYALRGLIFEGNGYFENEQYALALKKYLEVYSHTSDKNTAEKIADTYFAMKKYSLAHKYYSLVNTLQADEKAFLALLYHTNVEIPDNLSSLKKEINTYRIHDEEKFFYNNSLLCVNNFEECKKIFEDYLFQENVEINSSQLIGTKQTLQNYINFQIDDPLYKDALIIGNFYTLGMYPIAIKLGKDLLKQHVDYKPMLLIIAQSFYEIGDYKNAKGYLERYNALSPNDKNVLYLLGVIYLKNNDFILSNIFLNKAMELGYEPKINVVRRLIYNYDILGQKEKLLQEFEKLIKKNDNYSLEDAYLALYYHIIERKDDTAIELAKIVNQRYPNDGNIFGYLSWIYRLKKDYLKAEENIKKALILSPNSAFINLQMGHLLVDQGKKEEAIVSLQKTVTIGHDDEFSKQAQSILSTLQ